MRVQVRVFQMPNTRTAILIIDMFTDLYSLLNILLAMRIKIIFDNLNSPHMSNYSLSFFLKKSKCKDRNTIGDARISIVYILLISPTAAITDVLRCFPTDIHQDVIRIP